MGTKYDKLLGQLRQKDSGSTGTDTPQTIAYSATPAHDYSIGRNAEITLTGNVTSYTLQNVAQGSGGTIEIIQNATGGFGILAFLHTALTVVYLGGQSAIAANINAEANGKTLLNYYRSKTSNLLYVSFAAFNAAV